MKKIFRCENCFTPCELKTETDNETFPTVCPFDWDSPDFQEVEE